MKKKAQKTGLKYPLNIQISEAHDTNGDKIKEPKRANKEGY
jgi:hypothetical protein